MMGDPLSSLRSRLPFFRGTSAKSAISATSSNNRSRTSLLSPRNRKASLGGTTIYGESDNPPPDPSTPPKSGFHVSRGASDHTPDTSLETPRSTPLEKPGIPTLAVQAPTPDLLSDTANSGAVQSSVDNPETSGDQDTGISKPALQRPDAAPRQQSLVHRSQTKFLETLLESEGPQPQAASPGYFGPTAISANMLHRKIWVKRLGASATLVSINEDDLVDDVRDRILKKYANSLGRSFDAPDVTLRIVPRDHSHRHSLGERTLGPEEPIARALDSYFPGGQGVDEALVIDVPRRTTPRHSPRPVPYYLEDPRPVESGTDYFPVIPAGQHSPHLPSNISVASGHASSHHLPVHAMSVINTGQVPPLPSPGGTRGPRHIHRPKYGRTHTTSPTVISGTPGMLLHNNARSPSKLTLRSLDQKSHTNGIPAPPPMPSPGLPIEAPHRIDTPPPRVASPRPLKTANKPTRKPKDNAPKLPAGLLDGAVPPINVLIVEDNIINLRLLEAFMKRLKVRWHTAMNGREAVTKWRAGGFHLVLMDIQLPVMNGLDATKEIRRLERLNNIGVFSGSASTTPTFPNGVGSTGEGDESAEREVAKAEDTLMNTGLFKSPVIIVALTASSLQSDRHEALAAGCNDFLTKVRSPFTFPLFPALPVFSPSGPSRSPSSVLPLVLTTHQSPSTSSGWSAKSWNGAACKP